MTNKTKFYEDLIKRESLENLLKQDKIYLENLSIVNNDENKIVKQPTKIFDTAKFVFAQTPCFNS